MNKLVYILLLLFFIACDSNKDWLKVEYDSNLYHSFFDEHTWDYRWYIIKDDDGKFHSIMGDTITETDTARLYHTARIFTNHQGEHELNYCDARMIGDTLLLTFPAAYPAYWLEFEVRVINNNFKVAVGGVPFSPERFEWEVTKQLLTLQNNKYTVGDTIKGECSINFTERGINQNLALLDTEHNVIDSITREYDNQVHDGFYFTGAFKTIIE